AELYGTSMQAPGGRGFSPGETLVFRIARPEEIAPGDYVYLRAGGRALFRQAFVHGDRLRLRALNPADPEVDVGRAEIEHVARLVRRVKDY
ncbi:MAG: S24 family peptidase, partial [Planctomycetota bacterium]